ncbi:MAG: hypothetical protein WDM96_13340 [Lacunisphaera sp.]
MPVAFSSAACVSATSFAISASVQGRQVRMGVSVVGHLESGRHHGLRELGVRDHVPADVRKSHVDVLAGEQLAERRVVRRGRAVVDDDGDPLAGW